MNISTWFDSQRALFLFLLVCRFFHLFLFGAVCFHNRVPLAPDLPCVAVYRCTTYYVPCMYVYRVLLPLLLLLLCVAILLLLLHQLLLFVIVCRMAKIVSGSLNLIPSIVSFLLILKHELHLICTPWQCCRSHGLDLPILHPR